VKSARRALPVTTGSWFVSLTDAPANDRASRIDYNGRRPHSSLADRI